MKYLFLLLALALSGCAVNRKAVTVYLPDAAQDSQPFCLSNRTSGDVQIPHGATIHPGQMVRAAVVKDFQWGFTLPETSTDREDVDCFVVSR